MFLFEKWSNDYPFSSLRVPRQGITACLPYAGFRRFTNDSFPTYRIVCRRYLSVVVLVEVSPPQAVSGQERKPVNSYDRTYATLGLSRPLYVVSRLHVVNYRTFASLSGLPVVIVCKMTGEARECR